MFCSLLVVCKYAVRLEIAGDYRWHRNSFPLTNEVAVFLTMHIQGAA